MGGAAYCRPVREKQLAALKDIDDREDREELNSLTAFLARIAWIEAVYRDDVGDPKAALPWDQMLKEAEKLHGDSVEPAS